MKVPHERHCADSEAAYFIFLVVFAVKVVHKEVRGSGQNFNDPESNRISFSLPPSLFP